MTTTDASWVFARRLARSRCKLPHADRVRSHCQLEKTIHSIYRECEGGERKKLVCSPNRMSFFRIYYPRAVHGNLNPADGFAVARTSCLATIPRNRPNPVGSPRPSATPLKVGISKIKMVFGRNLPPPPFKNQILGQNRIGLEPDT